MRIVYFDVLLALLSSIKIAYVLLIYVIKKKLNKINYCFVYYVK